MHPECCGPFETRTARPMGNTLASLSSVAQLDCVKARKEKKPAAWNVDFFALHPEQHPQFCSGCGCKMCKMCA